MILLEKVISGGQTGADIGGIRAARRLGLQTGGSAPRGWETDDGPMPQLAEYGLVETGWGYAGRTSANVRDADATVRFAVDFDSPGEICTMKAVKRWKKPWIDIECKGAAVFVAGEGDASRECWYVDPVYFGDRRTVAEKLRAFLAEHCVRVLNVAGNRERMAPGIGALVEAFLIEALGPLRVAASPRV